MNPAPNLILVGPMGAGKTSIGRRLAERFGLEFADVDQAVVERCGATINTIFEHLGEAGFREREKAALAQLLAGEGSDAHLCEQEGRRQSRDVGAEQQTPQTAPALVTGNGYR